MLNLFLLQRGLNQEIKIVNTSILTFYEQLFFGRMINLHQRKVEASSKDCAPKPGRKIYERMIDDLVATDEIFGSIMSFSLTNNFVGSGMTLNDEQEKKTIRVSEAT